MSWAEDSIVDLAIAVEQPVEVTRIQPHNLRFKGSAVVTIVWIKAPPTRRATVLAQEAIESGT